MKEKELVDIIRTSLQDSAAVSAGLEGSMTPDILEAVSMLQSCIESGGKVLLMGNGGSASDAQHMTTELTGRFELDRVPLPFICLNTDSSLITAIGNDLGFREIFSRQIDALAGKKDLVVCFSTSGESENVIDGVARAREKGLKVIGFLGEGDSTLSKITDLSLRVPSIRTCRVQEGHITVVHVICECLEAIVSTGGSG